MTTSSEWQRERELLQGRIDQLLKVIEEQTLEINMLGKQVRDLTDACRLYRDAISINFWKIKDDNK